MKNHNLPPILWTKKETAKHFCCSITTIDRLIKNGKLKTDSEFKEGQTNEQLFINFRRYF